MTYSEAKVQEKEGENAQKGGQTKTQSSTKKKGEKERKEIKTILVNAPSNFGPGWKEREEIKVCEKKTIWGGISWREV